MTGTELAPDEKRCPFCAETIKAAAIKCRFCQSDLPAEGPSEPAPPPPPPPPPPVEDSPEPAPPAPDDPLDASFDDDSLDASADDGPSAVSATWRRAVAGLAVLCLLLGALLWFLADRARNPELGVAPNGQVTDVAFRDAAMSAASGAAEKALSYSHATFEEDRKAARALMGDKLAAQYEEAMDQVAEQTASSKLTLQAEVMSVGLLSAREHSATALLFVNTASTREGAKNQQIDQNRVLMELTRKDGDWIVSKMDAF